ncbi:MAG: TIGR04211 family SH3 domain-containing protein [Desulfuromonadaceae bacterium]|nr:TIGR04211 family SH3 domain-containing protein [Desulfuromonas sp.]MDY0184821.1 TIGR04211 family SH3 domain-containing protein [Desulfuromonadaceae bacterium]
MIRNLVASAFLCAICLGAAGSWAADTRYVSDQLVINLRAGQGNQYKITKNLITDTAVEVLEEHGDYLYVQLKDGTTGYVLTQYISPHIPKRQQIKKLQLEVEKLRRQVEGQQGAVAAQEMLQSELETLRQELASREQELVRIRELSDNAIVLDEESKRLQRELDEAQIHLSALQEENRTMLSEVSIRWFLAGGGTLLLGWILGKFSRRKARSSFGKF